MLPYLARRIANYALLLFIATSLAYILASASLDPANNWNREDTTLNWEAINANLIQYNISSELPVWGRYVTWLKTVVTSWDWGVTPKGESINGLIGTKIAVSVRLVFLGAAIGVAAFASGFLSLGTDLYTDPKIKRGYIDHSGTEIVSPKNNYNSTFADGMALVVVKGKWGCVNEKGAYIVEPKYNEMHRFSEDMAAVKDGDKWGFVGRDGQIAIAPAYEAVHDFHEGLAVVSKGGKSFFIDKTGRVPFLLPSTVTEIGMFNEGFAPVKIGDKWGFIDHAGTIVIAPAYDAAGTF